MSQVGQLDMLTEKLKGAKMTSQASYVQCTHGLAQVNGWLAVSMSEVSELVYAN